MGVVFVVLSVLALSVRVFDRLDELVSSEKPSATPAAAVAPARAPVSTPPSPPPGIPETDDAETAAVIAVALALADEESRPAGNGVSGPVRQITGSSWVSSGRSREMANRMAGGPGRGRRQ